MTREEAIKTLHELWRETNDSWYEEVYNMAIEALQAEYEDYEHATLVDIKEPLKVLVVRCKDCRWWQDNNNGYPHANCHWCETETPDADDFCSLGERKTK